MKGYRSVEELTKDELSELKNCYYMQLEDEDDEILNGIDSPEEIPDVIIFEHYEGISFVKDDFFCNMQMKL